MHDALYENQNALGPEFYLAAAQSFDLPGAELGEALRQHAFKAKIRSDFMGGLKSGVNGTPSFFINSTRHDGAFDFESLVAAIDAGFLRPRRMVTMIQAVGYHVVDREPPRPNAERPSPHRARNSAPARFRGRVFIGGSNKAHVLRAVTEDYLRRSGLDIKLDRGVDNIAMAISLVASTRGLALMPAYAKDLLPWSVVSRPLEGEAPTIDLVVGYSK
jgi:hypothetical protein